MSCCVFAIVPQGVKPWSYTVRCRWDLKIIASTTNRVEILGILCLLSLDNPESWIWSHAAWYYFVFFQNWKSFRKLRARIYTKNPLKNLFLRVRNAGGTTASGAIILSYEIILLIKAQAIITIKCKMWYWYYAIHQFICRSDYPLRQGVSSDREFPPTGSEFCSGDLFRAFWPKINE